MVSSPAALDEHFDGGTLDRAVWLPHYLPHWSSRAESAATWSLQDDGLHLSIPVEQPRWCAGLHEEPLRVSCIQSGSFAGPEGSTVGQLPFQDGLVVREAQPTFWGYTPHFGHVEVRMRGDISARSMFAFWMSGIEDDPARSGEICVAEIFGETVADGSADVGTGTRRFRDPTLAGEFSAIPLPIDVAEFHTYGVDWRPGSTDITVDGEVVRHVDEAPDYPMQLFIGVFDFPAKASDDQKVRIPEMVIAHVQGHPLD